LVGEHRGDFLVHLSRDVDDVRRTPLVELDVVAVENLGRPVFLSFPELLEPGEEAGVEHELRRDPVVRMALLVAGEDHEFRAANARMSRAMRAGYFFSGSAGFASAGLGGSAGLGASATGASPSLRPFLNSLMPDPTPRMSCGILEEPKRITITATMMMSSIGL